jgi:hypothetical protein
MSKIVKFGYINRINSISGEEFIIKVRILNETRYRYKVDYLKLIKGNRSNIDFNLLHNFVERIYVYDIYEKKLNWLQRIFL